LRAIPSVLGDDQAAFLVRRRVAHLATSDRLGKPHAVPVCFALARASILIALDEKPKDVPVTRLKRVRNILENPHVALIADRYAEDWNLLAFVMVRGRAELLDPGTEEHTAAVRLLRGKYHQYEAMRIEENPVIAIRPERAASWGALDEPDSSGPRVLDTIHGRRSVRSYLQKRVPEDLVERVLEAARWAPSPHGRQPWRFAVLSKEVTKERLARAMGEEWTGRVWRSSRSASKAPADACLTRRYSC
jgi:coenzyme F420-0:L-glutamate ligase/coenzyme F420-1:gamma-L-glutamate ligase